MEEVSAEKNEVKVHQTKGVNQLLDEFFTADLGRFVEVQYTNALLDGTYISPATANPATVNVLQACKRPQHCEISSNLLPIINRYNTIKHSWNLRKENTCTYNQHMGHYKAIMKHNYLIWFFFQREEIPGMYGYSPVRHRKCIDLMILKKQMNFELKKQKTLVIIDTEYNQNNKMVGKIATDNGLKLKTIATEQFSKPGSSSIDQMVANRYIIDHHQYNKICFALTSSDLTGYYDRIIHIAAALALLQIGIPHSVIRSMFDTIQRMVHMIRLAFGDSDITYGGDDIGDG